MVLTPRIAGTHVVPAGGGRYAAHVAGYPNEYSSVNELRHSSSLFYDGESEFQYDQLNAKQDLERHYTQNQYAHQNNDPHFGRLIDNEQGSSFNLSIIGNTSETFAALFAETAGNYSIDGNKVQRYHPIYSLDVIIDTYETNALVIHGALPSCGERLNVVL